MTAKEISQVNDELALLNEYIKKMCETDDRDKIVKIYFCAARKIEKIYELNLKRVSQKGHWIKHGTMVECSICEHSFIESEIRYNKDYCPFCNAKMKGE